MPGGGTDLGAADLGAADLGAADPALLAALESANERSIWAALPAARLLVAVLALPGTEQASEGEMALALLESASGEQALPAFTSLAALTQWRGDARPVPRPAEAVIGYARAESLAVVLDPGTRHAWTIWPAGLAGDRPTVDPAPADESGFTAPTWRPSRRARRTAIPHEVYAVDTDGGVPAVAVVCPQGTLDAGWARRLLAQCPPGTGVVALHPQAQPAVARLGRRL